jgi:hypothetical protein
MPRQLPVSGRTFTIVPPPGATDADYEAMCEALNDLDLWRIAEDAIVSRLGSRYAFDRSRLVVDDGDGDTRERRISAIDDDETPVPYSLTALVVAAADSLRDTIPAPEPLNGTRGIGTGRASDMVPQVSR